jgi:hypothetical protein
MAYSFKEDAMQVNAFVKAVFFDLGDAPVVSGQGRRGCAPAVC